MIVVTGALGFIGSCVVKSLKIKGIGDVVAVDDFSKTYKLPNLRLEDATKKVERKHFFRWADKNVDSIKIVIHLGARTDTTEMNESIFEILNIDYTKRVWRFCSDNNIPLIYASSAATYGLGLHGFVDNHALVPRLEPLNPYGWSKQSIDLWAINQGHQPPRWYGLKFFNVYGPNEYHKGRMASVVFHAFNQIKDSGSMNLFKSHIQEYGDGEQSRDFIYIKDVLKIIWWFINNEEVEDGLYNVGTGTARSFYDLTKATFAAMNKEVKINFIDTPIDIRDNYQYYTEAEMSKLQNAGYNDPFYSLEEGIKDYVQNYLLPERKY